VPSQPFYITTPIYYVNAAPHLGTFYSTVVADALARFHRARGDDTFFLTGLDEHGQKIQRIAVERKIPEQEFCDGVAAQFQETWKLAEISNDAFVRTSGYATGTSDGVPIKKHRDAVHDMWRRIASNVGPDGPDIYQGEYDGMYCVGCEDYKTEDDIVEEAGEKLCPIHRRPVERVKEKNYFFRLSRYADYLLGLYKDPTFIRPTSRSNEVASFVGGPEGLRDLSISRMKKSVSWGIDVPGDPEHTVYVWLDALTNYLTALGGPDAVAAGGEAQARWAGSHHLIAKDILRFHAVYWPALLKSAGLPPPKNIFCHGYLTVKGQKISKSMPATKVDPKMIAEDLGVEPLRYFVLREYSLGGDGDFTYEALLQRHESELGNDLGNLLNRTVSMTRQFLGGTATAFDGAPQGGVDEALPPIATEAIAEATAAWNEFRPAQALEGAWKLVRAANRYIDERKPWVMAKQEPAPGRIGLNGVLASCLEALRISARLIAPAMPQTAAKILRQIGRPEAEASTWPAGDAFQWPGGTVSTPEPLFPRLDGDRKAALIAKWLPPQPAVAADAAPAATPTSPAAATAPTPFAPIDKADFDKIELRAARVLTCERVPKTEKLLKLTLDLGTEQRTVISGIASAYAPEALVGRTVVYLANLKPAKIRGVISQGMILAAGDAEVLALTALDRDVPPGTPIR